MGWRVPLRPPSSVQASAGPQAGRRQLVDERRRGGQRAQVGGRGRRRARTGRPPPPAGGRPPRSAASTTPAAASRSGASSDRRAVDVVAQDRLVRSANAATPSGDTPPVASTTPLITVSRADTRSVQNTASACTRYVQRPSRRHRCTRPRPPRRQPAPPPSISSTWTRSHRPACGGRMGRPWNGGGPVEAHGATYQRGLALGALVVTPAGSPQIERSTMTDVIGAIRAKSAGLGGEAGFGVPLDVEQPTFDGVGRTQPFANGRFIAWHPSTGALVVWGAIATTWVGVGREPRLPDHRRARLPRRSRSVQPLPLGAPSRPAGGLDLLDADDGRPRGPWRHPRLAGESRGGSRGQARLSHQATSSRPAAAAAGATSRAASSTGRRSAGLRIDGQVPFDDGPALNPVNG